MDLHARSCIHQEVQSIIGHWPQQEVSSTCQFCVCNLHNLFSAPAISCYGKNMTPFQNLYGLTVQGTSSIESILIHLRSDSSQISIPASLIARYWLPLIINNCWDKAPPFKCT